MNHHQLIERLLKSPLYYKHQLKTEDIDEDTRRLLLSDGRFDLYCPQCKKNSTWALVVDPDAERVL